MAASDTAINAGCAFSVRVELTLRPLPHQPRQILAERIIDLGENCARRQGKPWRAPPPCRRPGFLGPGKMKAMLIRGTARAAGWKVAAKDTVSIFSVKLGQISRPSLRLTDVSRAEKSRLRQIVRARRVSAKRPARKRSCIREIRHESREACRRPCRYRNPDREPARSSPSPLTWPWKDKTPSDPALVQLSSVENVTAAINKSDPPTVTVTVDALAPTPNYTELQLTPRIGDPDDLIFAFDAKGRPPQDITTQVVTPVSFTVEYSRCADRQGRHDRGLIAKQLQGLLGEGRESRRNARRNRSRRNRSARPSPALQSLARSLIRPPTSNRSGRRLNGGPLRKAAGARRRPPVSPLSRVISWAFPSKAPMRGFAPEQRTKERQSMPLYEHVFLARQDISDAAGRGLGAELPHDPRGSRRLDRQDRILGPQVPHLSHQEEPQGALLR